MNLNKININISSEYKYNQSQISTTFNEIKTRLDNNKLNLNPDYQREVVWNEEKSESLIESIIHGYFIPPIILNLIDGKYNCIDGKQRITSVYKFLNNDIRYCINDKELVFDDFDDQSKESFLNRSFQTCLYQELDYETELEIFRRVQKGEPMKKMEIMRSYNTTLISNISINIEKYKNIWKKYNIKCNRDNNLNYVLRSLMLEYKKDKGFITLTIPEVQKFVINYNNIYNKEIEKIFYSNLEKLFNFLDKNISKLERLNKPLTILEFIILYKLISNDDLNDYYINFIEYFKNNTNNKCNMTTYTPVNLNDSYIYMLNLKIK